MDSKNNDELSEKLYELAELLYDSLQFEEAIKICEQAEKCCSPCVYPEATLIKGMAYEALGSYDFALAAYDKADADCGDGEFIGGTIRKVTLLFSLFEIKSAIEALNHAYDETGEEFIYSNYFESEINDNISILDENKILPDSEFINSEFKNKAKLYFIYANILSKLNRIDDAIEAYDVAINNSGFMDENTYSYASKLAGYQNESNNSFYRSYEKAAFYKAKLLEKKGMIEEARIAYEKAAFDGCFQMHGYTEHYSKFLYRNGMKIDSLLMRLRDHILNDRDTVCDFESREEGLLELIKDEYRDEVDEIKSDMLNFVKNKDPFELLKRGEILFFLKEYERAIPFLTKAEEESPNGMYLRATDFKIICLDVLDRQEEGSILKTV